MINIGYTRFGYNNIGSAVPISSGIEKFCLTEDQKLKYFVDEQDNPEVEMEAYMSNQIASETTEPKIQKEPKAM